MALVGMPSDSAVVISQLVIRSVKITWDSPTVPDGSFSSPGTRMCCSHVDDRARPAGSDLRRPE